jgi:hypothetical protein
MVNFEHHLRTFGNVKIQPETPMGKAFRAQKMHRSKNQGPGATIDPDKPRAHPKGKRRKGKVPPSEAWP